MTTKERLHRLVDSLPERDLDTAARVLEALQAMGDPVARTLDSARDDDEPDDDNFDGGLSEARAEAEAGLGTPLDEIPRELGR